MGTDVPSPVNPWGDMDICDIPIEIVDHFSDMEDEVCITESTKKSIIYFKPLNDDDRRIVAMKFNLVINGKTNPVKFCGVAKVCPYPVITQATKGNGACLLITFSMLLAGRDTYSAIIHHAVCNYISDPVKHKW